MIDLKLLIIETAQEAARIALEQACSPSRYLKPRDAAKYLGVAYITLETWRGRGQGPSYCKLGRSIRYDRQALDSFMLSHRQDCDESIGGSAKLENAFIKDPDQSRRARITDPRWVRKKIYA